MKLGIMVTSDRHLAHVVGVTRAALRQGHTVTLFATDDGVRLLTEPAYAGLSGLPGVRMSFCDHSARLHGGAPGGLPAAIAAGSQFENALMLSESDRVLVF